MGGEGAFCYNDMRHMGAAEKVSWWRRWLRRWLEREAAQPAWGAGPPTILGVCRRCGAVVLKGWHREAPGGYLCQRCAGREREA
jgi:hypothetical protein